MVRHISWRELRGCEIFPTFRRIYTREPYVLKTKVHYHYKLVHSFRSIASLWQEVRYWSSYSNLACAVSFLKSYCLMNATDACMYDLFRKVVLESLSLPYFRGQTTVHGVYFFQNSLNLMSFLPIYSKKYYFSSSFLF